MKLLLVSLGMVFSLTALAETPVFSFDSRDYGEGEALSAKGVSGGSWVGTGSSPVFSDGGFEAGGESVALKASDEFSDSDVRTVEFTVRCEASGGKPEVPTGVSAALIPDGAVFYGLGEGRWQTLSASGFAWADGAWLDCRFVVRTVGGQRCVSYFVKVGEAWAALAAADGRTSFGMAAESARPYAGVSGVGSFSAIACRDAEPSAETVYRWIGGTSGDWGDTNNWQVAGATATRVPGTTGDVAVISGAVALTQGTQKAEVKDLFVDFATGTSIAAAGEIQTAVSLDTKRPRIGTALEAKVDSLFGVRTAYECVWTSRDCLKAKSATTLASSASYVPTAADCDRWLALTATPGAGNAARPESAPYQFKFLFSRLPVCYLTYEGDEEPGTDTSGGTATMKKEYSGAVRVQGGEAFGFMYDGGMKIKARGNSTLWYAKKAYKIKLDKKTDMFGFGKNKHWVLLANYNDMSAMRNKLAYDLANEIGSLGMNSTWVQCTLNGTYVGLYQFCEHLRPDDKRVPVKDWEDIAEESGGSAEDLSCIDLGVHDIAGGYIFEFSNEADEATCFTNRSGKLAMQTMAKAPEYLKTNTNMFNWCVGFLQNYWDACTSCYRRSKEGKHYSAYCDVDSMVTFFLVNEFFTNLDDCEKSRYAYMADGQKLKFGPVWDFDWGSQSVRVSIDDTDRWMCLGESHNERKDDERATENSMIKEWASDPYFARLACQKYWAVRPKLAAIAADGGTIDTHAAYLKEAQAADDTCWVDRRYNTHGKTTWGTTWKRTSAEDTAILKANLARRLAWFDLQFASPRTLLESMRSDIQTNPWKYSPGTVLLVR